ncbi:MAG: 2-oxoacid:ferredoxin oxidoreductase subunit beta [Planctomycetota bacterium JB042]
MSDSEAPAAPSPKTNRLGLVLQDYRGAKSTLCAGCGHDAISAAITQAFFELGVDQHDVAKLSGIGCSSKTPAYFLGRSFGFNSVHGRMPAVATGTNLANRQLRLVAVSGDGDSASIGLGQFVHFLRRNVRMLYVIENNGVYGLTKGQFSATADVDSVLKHGTRNDLEAIDTCGLAVELGCDFVARSFSGDRKQLVPLIKAAAAHGGTALLDVISPCVTFNDHDGSTKSYKYTREHDWALHEIGFVPGYENVDVEIAAGETKDVELPDGSHITLKKLDEDYDPTDRLEAQRVLHRAREERKIVTGLLYVNPESRSFADALQLVDRPLATLGEADLRPGAADLAAVMDALK